MPDTAVPAANASATAPRTGLSTGEAMTASSSSTVSLLARYPMPARIGRFEVIRVLGRGAQSIVYLATDPMLEREVAIKALPNTVAADAHQLLAEAALVVKKAACASEVSVSFGSDLARSAAHSTAARYPN